MTKFFLRWYENDYVIYPRPTFKFKWTLTILHKIIISRILCTCRITHSKRNEIWISLKICLLWEFEIFLYELSPFILHVHNWYSSKKLEVQDMILIFGRSFSWIFTKILIILLIIYTMKTHIVFQIVQRNVSRKVFMWLEWTK